MNLGQQFIIRHYYTVTDLLADIGGLGSILMIILSLLLSVMNYMNFQTFMASRLFKIKKEDTEASNLRYFERSDFFKASKTSNVRLYCMDILPKKLVCCRRNRAEKGIQQAIRNMEKETDIIEMIKLMRFFKLAIRQLMQEKKQRMELKERSRYKSIDPDGYASQDQPVADLKLLKLCHIM